MSLRLQPRLWKLRLSECLPEPRLQLLLLRLLLLRLLLRLQFCLLHWLCDRGWCP